MTHSAACLFLPLSTASHDIALPRTVEWLVRHTANQVTGPLTAMGHFGRMRRTILAPAAANETTRLHHLSRQCHGMAACGARAAGGDAGDRPPRRRIA